MAPSPAPCRDHGPGDRRIAELLRDAVDAGGAVIPARSCRLDGFVDDTISEYANPSVLRPSAVQAGRVPSSLSWVADRAGRFYVGVTLYAAADSADEVAVWVGHRQLGTIRIQHGDNRIHLFTLPRKLKLRGGESIRLVATADSGACRVEHLALLVDRPGVKTPRLTLRELEYRCQPAPEGTLGTLTFLTTRPARGRIGLRRTGQRRWTWVQVESPLQCHEAGLADVEAGASCEYLIEMQDAEGRRLRRRGRCRAARAGRAGGMDASLRLRARRSTAVPWPVSTGFPLPEGACTHVDALELIGGRQATACQFEALSHWPDGSLKWVLADFHGDGRQDLRIRHRRAAPVGLNTGIRVSSSPSETSVDTGPLRLRFRRRHRGGLPVVEDTASGRPLLRPPPGGDLDVVEEGGRRFREGEPTSIAVETTGPLRVCVRVTCELSDGRGRAAYRSVYRIHAWADSRRIRCCHWLELLSTDEPFRRLASATLAARLVGVGRQRRLQGESRSGRHVLRLRQSTDCRFELTTAEGRRLRGGRRGRGSAEWSGPAGEVEIAVPEFWQRYPSGLEVGPAGFRLEICPPLQSQAYRGRSAEEQERLYFHLKDGVHELRTGVAVSTDFWLRLGGAPQDSMLPAATAPPLYAPDLQHLNRCRVLPRLAGKSASPRPAYEAWVAEARRGYAQSRKRFRAYGQLSFGDWFGERFYNWGNLEYDATWAFLQEFLRGGETDFRDWADQAARHLVDTDTVHDHPDPGRVGWQYTHCVGHVGGYYPEGYRERAQFSGRWSPSHTWVEGLFILWLLGGERRYLESALSTCHLLTGASVNDYDFTNCRTSGWHLIHLCAAHAASGRMVYLNAARLIVERVLERQRDTGGWDRLMVPGHCFCEPPRHRGNAGFMVGILMTGLQRYHEVTGDDRVAASIVAAADFCIDQMWNEERACFHYTSCPRSGLVGAADMRILKGIAFAYRASRLPRLRRVLEAGLDSALAGGGAGGGRGAGKGICARMRGAAQVLAALPRRRSGSG